VEYKKSAYDRFAHNSCKEISKYKLDIVGVQKVRWDRDATEPVGEYTFFCEKGNENYELGKGFCT
jgi:hypothetical protein